MLLRRFFDLDEFGYGYPTHCYTFRNPLAAGGVLGNGDGARCCFPCIDTLAGRCPWSLTFNVEKGVKVFATGTLMEKDVNTNVNQDIFSFHLHERVNASAIGFAVGHFRNVQVDHSVSLGQVTDTTGAAAGAGAVFNGKTPRKQNNTGTTTISNATPSGTAVDSKNNVTSFNSIPKLNYWVLGDALLEEDDTGLKTGLDPSYSKYHSFYSSFVNNGKGNSSKDKNGLDASQKLKKEKERRKKVERTVANTMAALPQACSFVRKWLTGDLDKQNVLNNSHPGMTLPFYNQMTIVYVQGTLNIQKLKFSKLCTILVVIIVKIIFISSILF